MSRRKKKKASSKCPEPFNTLIDLAAAATMDYIFYKRRQKHGGKRNGKIDPYAATGAAMGLGLINDTEDLIKFGGVLGAMGAFDPDDELYIDTASYSKPRDNRYAWRLNCEDGSSFGIDPDDYETRDEYNAALHREKYGWRSYCEDGSDYGIEPDDYETEEEYEDALSTAQENADLLQECSSDERSDCAVDITPEEGPMPPEPDALMSTPKSCEGSDPFTDDDFHVYVYCLVELSASKEKVYFRTEDHALKRGDCVAVPNLSGNVPTTGVILSVEHHMRFSVPQPVESTPEIIGRG